MAEDYDPNDFEARDQKRAEEVEDERLIEALDREAQVAQLNVLLGDESMRDFLWRVLTKCHVFSTSFNRNFGDMALNEGQRQVGLWLLTEIAEANPDALLTMQTKANRYAAQQAAKKRKQALSGRPARANR